MNYPLEEEVEFLIGIPRAKTHGPSLPRTKIATCSFPTWRPARIGGGLAEACRTPSRLSGDAVVLRLKHSPPPRLPCVQSLEPHGQAFTTPRQMLHPCELARTHRD